MGEVKWTEDQQKVIDYRDRDILVSAAAGSGKTAVLVERIIKIITDKENPVDIDKLLVVTFTKAAAAEMRERITKAIDKQYEKDPENLNLEKQLTLVHNANITTIDSFCNSIVRNHFGEINLEPNFRIADQGELKLIQQDVVDKLFEEYYEEKNEDFLNLIDTYTNGNKDKAIRDIILQIANEAESNPWPKEWIVSLKDDYSQEKIKEIKTSNLFDSILKNTKNTLRDFLNKTKLCVEESKEYDALQKVTDVLEHDAAFYEKAIEIDDFEKMREIIKSNSFCRWSGGKASDEVKLKKDALNKIRKSMKDEIEAIKKNYFALSIDAIVTQMQTIAPFVNTIVDITLKFVEEYEKAKQDKHVASFSDVEHFALKILVNEETKEITDVARQYQANIHEIMIDEYQDSNDLQEAILTAISKNAVGGHNLFMVGDIKQSIYRFRQAKPELFMDKYNRFKVGEEAKEQRIDLAMNFRSRIEVVTFVNDIFKKIMNADLGNVTYDKAASLNCGANYIENTGNEPEILLFEGAKESEDSKIVVEAKMVANRIKKLVKEHKVVDKETNQLREVKYSDIVILLRSTTAGQDFLKVLLDNGIPTTMQTRTGYFSAKEVQTVLAFLMILDNPYQDIPMVTVLKSEFAGIYDDELAELRISMKKPQFSYVVVEYCNDLLEKAKQGEEFERESLEYKLYNFWKKYIKIRNHVVDTSTHELIQLIFDEFNYLNYVVAMPAGDRREANLKMLLEKAIAYENTSYKGVFHFVRFIQQMKKYEIDFGEADVSSEDSNEVKIMTIHKSKGLEFPIVFVSNLDKQFNEQDSKQIVVLDQKLGLGIQEMGATPRYKRESFRRKMINEKIKKDNLGEELRILYVALTRAKEKLILTGCLSKSYEDFIKEVKGQAKEGMFLDYNTRYKAKNYLNWIVPAVLSYNGLSDHNYNIDIITQEDLVTETIEEIAENKMDEMTLKNTINDFEPDDMACVADKIEYEYPFKEDIDKKIKYSVSEIKKQAMVEAFENEIGEETPILDIIKKDVEENKRIPNFIEQNEASENLGAKRGTAVHRLLQCINFKELLVLEDYSYGTIKSFLEAQIKRILAHKLMSKEDIDIIYMQGICKFLSSKCALKMAKADKEGKLYCEKPFVMLYNDALVQGIIDVFWIEDGKIMLLDYKTDKVANEQELIKRYAKQLELYEIALNRVFNVQQDTLKKTERLIYSFCLDKVIKV
ncbi:helicase-exonuclease AddAB subunit AddA [Lachnobacterium bovis]|uniref:helicase-exonuclease AddAB subunit AddA n=1 Tax=Lachnobacterium bovis TaxID=140626 RepID=UPI00048E8571|nr:helicase-exonuclease AddAB subunit AddA [Lachnobacterium bovis]